MADYILHIEREIKCCSECPCIFEYFSKFENKQIFHCSARNEDESRFADDFDINTKPTEGCPLVELPPHGRLGDLDANRDDFMNTVYGECSSDGDNYRANRIIDAYDDLPTVVPASEGE